jgi:hypothetical protein
MAKKRKRKRKVLVGSKAWKKIYESLLVQDVHREPKRG